MKNFTAFMNLLVLVVIANYPQLGYSKEWPTLIFYEGIPYNSDLRALKVQQTIPPYPASTVNDTVRAIWEFFPHTGAGNYRKVSITSSVQWLETNWQVGAATGGSGCMPPNPLCSPLLIDLGRDGFSPGEESTGVHFDMLGQGDLIYLQWVAPQGNDGFLAIDLNRNGIIDNGLELFGEGTVMLATGERAGNGYSALQQYDKQEYGGNANGVLDEQDEVWPKLVIWTDINADGVSSNGEVSDLVQEKIVAIDVKPRLSKNRQDSAGNYLPYWSWVDTNHRKGPKKMRMVDIYFRILE